MGTDFRALPQIGKILDTRSVLITTTVPLPRAEQGLVAGLKQIPSRNPSANAAHPDVAVSRAKYS
jgi:hypothetical protein